MMIKTILIVILAVAFRQRPAEPTQTGRTRRREGYRGLIWSASKALTTNTRRLSQPPLLQMPTSSTYTDVAESPAEIEGRQGERMKTVLKDKITLTRPSHSIHKTGCLPSSRDSRNERNA